MDRRVVFVFAVSSFTCALALTAHADIAPPPGYVETCSVQRHQSADKQCVACRAWFRERDACVKQYGAQGYTSACRSRGASVWTEVWCKSASTAAAADAGMPDLDAGLPTIPAPAPPTPPPPTPVGDDAGAKPEPAAARAKAARARSASCGVTDEGGSPSAGALVLAALAGALLVTVRRRARTARAAQGRR
jgi:MYXO-CTERM domain-containing protein